MFIKLILSIFLLTVGLSHAQVSKRQLVKMTKELIQLSGVPKPIYLYIKDSNQVNGWATCGRRITITTGAMKQFNYYEMMSTVGHELGHINLNHVGKRILGICVGAKYVWKKSEADADLYSIRLMKKGNYDACKAFTSKFKYYLKTDKNNGLYDNPKDPHPSILIRLKQVKKYACH